MRCKILLFAQLVDEVGARSLELELPDDATVSDAIDALAKIVTSIAPFKNPIAIAVNQRYVRPDYELNDGDTIALIPPVSGG